jgi:isocitrate dehydrogenase
VTRHLSFISGQAGAAVEEGIMTCDLLTIAEIKSSNKKVNTEGFIDVITEPI